MTSEKCLEDHNKISKKIEFLSKCEKEDPNKKDADSKDEEGHLCFIMRWYCTRQCTMMSAYGQKCDVESLFTLNLEEDNEGYPETLDCVCSYNKSKRGCLSAYQIGWDTVLEEFETNFSIIMRNILFIGGQEEPGRHTILNTVSRCKNLNRARAEAAVAILAGVPYVCGGYGGTGCLSSCERYTTAGWKDGKGQMSFC